MESTEYVPLALGTEAHFYRVFRDWVIIENVYECTEEEELQEEPYFFGEFEYIYNGEHSEDLLWWRGDKTKDGRTGYGFNYLLHAKCDAFMKETMETLLVIFCREYFGNTYEAFKQTHHIIELWNLFERWFDGRRRKFLENMKAEIKKKSEVGMKLRPGSVGGTANLLKVLTKTMEMQGASIQNIARMQYDVCLQSGIILPDVFITDVAVALTIEEEAANDILSASGQKVKLL